MVGLNCIYDFARRALSKALCYGVKFVPLHFEHGGSVSVLSFRVTVFPHLVQV